MASSPEHLLARRALVLFALIATLIAVDLAADWGEGAGAAHVLFEALVMALATAGLLFVAQRLRRLHGDAQRLRGELAVSHEEAERWRSEARELLAGLGAAIDRQFERWQLTPAEREVGLLLLKGLSHQEVADVRGTSERTVRQQARAVYKKAGLSGRADLAAYFLEDLLLPRASPSQVPRFSAEASS